MNREVHKLEITKLPIQINESKGILTASISVGEKVIVESPDYGTHIFYPSITLRYKTVKNKIITL